VVSSQIGGSFPQVNIKIFETTNQKTTGLHILTRNKKTQETWGTLPFQWKMTFPTARSLVVPWSVGRWTFGSQATEYDSAKVSPTIAEKRPMYVYTPRCFQKQTLSHT